MIKPLNLVRLLIIPAVLTSFYQMLGCSSDSFTATEVVCTDETEERIQLAIDVYGVQISDANDDLISLDEDSLTITQSINVVEAEYPNYSVFPDYTYLMQLTFTYSEGGTEYNVTMSTNRFDNLENNLGSSVLFSINDTESTVDYDMVYLTDSLLSSSSYPYYYTASTSYTHNSEERHLLVTWYGGSGSDYQLIDTVYNIAIACSLNCTETTYGFGDGAHKISCDYNCDDGSLGNFESETLHIDATLDPIDFLYEEEEIQSIADDCLYESHTINEDMTTSFSVPVNP